MTDALIHRGPDGEGFYLDAGIGFGHRRLAIIDLSTGHQPMSNSAGTIHITFNGEIYNFLELRKALEEKGYEFRTRSDTEVIINAWEEWGPAAVDKLRGMFAFAIWDNTKQCVYLVRDRLGEKPLYYAMLNSGELIFGSELKALLVHPGCPRTIGPQAVEDFFSFGYIPEPRSIYAGVKKVGPGMIVAFRRGGPETQHLYWSPQPRASQGGFERRADELTMRLSASVKSQMVSDVPIGAFLSGGIDSGATTSLMAKASAHPIRAFTIGFDEAKYDESEYASRVASRCGAIHRVKTVRADDLAPLYELPRIFDEPFGDSSALPALQLARLAREDVTVALSGDGGDELFGGYRRYKFHQTEERLRHLMPQYIRGPVFGFLARLYPRAAWAPRVFRARQTFHELSLDTAWGYFENVAVIESGTRRGLYSNTLKRDLQGYNSVETIAKHFNEAPCEDVLAAAQYVDLKTWLPGDILTKVDRTAMAASLETRVPILDHDLVDWALGLPSEMKLLQGEGKRILKHALEGIIPDDILYRPKQGFSIPLSEWMLGSLGAEFERDVTGSCGLSECGLFNMGAVRRLLTQHRARTHDHARILWQLWMFQHFLTQVHEPVAPVH